MTRLSLDHIVIGTASLEEGCRWLENKLGVPAVGGGKHALMGTHNALWRLDCCYLELVAIDHAAAFPDRPRWFGLDNPIIQTKLRARPRLLTWVAATNGIALDVATTPIDLGDILEAKRDKLAWRITVPKDGSVPAGGAFPTLIQWAGGAISPKAALPEQGLLLEELSVGLRGDSARFLSLRGIAAPVFFGEIGKLKARISNPAKSLTLVVD